MARRGSRLALRLIAAALLCLTGIALLPAPARAFGDAGAFHARVLLVGSEPFEGARSTAPARLAWELTRRTSAPARLAPARVRADSPSLLADPFVWWIGERDPGALSAREVSGLRQFLALGGILLVDDAAPDKGDFGRAARRELARVVPDVAPIPIGEEHVVFRTFYLLRRPEGRVSSSAKLEAIVRNGSAQVIFTAHDLAGALAASASGIPALSVHPGGELQREMATRLAVNVAMYVLCTNYKDDQVHAPFLMRRRARDL